MLQRNFAITLQLGSVAAVSLFSTQAASVPLAVLAVLFGVSMTQATQEFRRNAISAR